MGAKTFINQTGHDLNIEITVRAGEETGDAAAVESLLLQNGNQQYFQYSEDDNPYLDGIIANAADDPNIAGEMYVYAKNDSGDDALNTNNTVTFTVQDTSVILSCSNQ